MLRGVLLGIALTGAALTTVGSRPSAPAEDLRAPHDVPDKPVRDVQLAATRDGRLVLGVITDLGPATQGRGVLIERTLHVWAWQRGA